LSPIQIGIFEKQAYLTQVIFTTRKDAIRAILFEVLLEVNLPEVTAITSLFMRC